MTIDAPGHDLVLFILLYTIYPNDKEKCPQKKIKGTSWMMWLFNFGSHHIGGGGGGVLT